MREPLRSPRVSIIVPSRDGRVDRLREQLARQTLEDWELIVNTAPPTPGHARNLGAAQARGRWLVFFDDDVRLSDPRLLEDLVRTLEGAPAGAVIGVSCRVIPEASRFQRAVAGDPAGDGSADSACGLVEVSWCDTVNGRCMAMARETFWNVGGFDPALVSGEDPELVYRIHRAGGPVFLLYRHWVYFTPPPTLRVLTKKTIWYERGNAQVARKHPQAGYRMVLRGPLHAAAYLALRTLALVPLMFVRISYRSRRPVPTFRPASALLSYLGAWVYCLSWFNPPTPSVIRAYPRMDARVGGMAAALAGSPPATSTHSEGAG
jgi:glycosyltransferase involved in cell wall biosynthesis